MPAAAAPKQPRKSRDRVCACSAASSLRCKMHIGPQRAAQHVLHPVSARRLRLSEDSLLVVLSLYRCVRRGAPDAARRRACAPHQHLKTHPTCRDTASHRPTTNSGKEKDASTVRAATPPAPPPKEQGARRAAARDPTAAVSAARTGAAAEAAAAAAAAGGWGWGWGSPPLSAEDLDGLVAVAAARGLVALRAASARARGR